MPRQPRPARRHDRHRQRPLRGWRPGYRWSRQRDRTHTPARPARRPAPGSSVSATPGLGDRRLPQGPSGCRLPPICVSAAISKPSRTRRPEPPSRMALEVRAREDWLRQERRELRIEIDGQRQARKVAEITGTEYFKGLRDRARDPRKIIEDCCAPGRRVGRGSTSSHCDGRY